MAENRTLLLSKAKNIIKTVPVLTPTSLIILTNCKVIVTILTLILTIASIVINPNIILTTRNIMLFIRAYVYGNRKRLVITCTLYLSYFWIDFLPVNKISVCLCLVNDRIHSQNHCNLS